MYEIGLGIILTLFAITAMATLTVGEPPTPPKSRSFGNERPPLNERKPPKIEPPKIEPPKIERTQSEHDFLWLAFYAKGMENDTLLEDKSEEFKAGYSEAMKDVRWGIDHINEFHKYEELTDE